MNKFNVKAIKKLFTALFRSLFPYKKRAYEAQLLEDHIAKPECPACDGSNIVMFNWESANEKSANDLTKYTQGIRHEKNLRAGQLYYCPYCEQRWYLDREEVFMSIVPQERLPYLHQWNRMTLNFSDKQLALLETIGATPTDLYGNGQGVISVPCEVTGKDGSIYRKAIIRFQSYPPIDEWQKNWHFANEVVCFRESDFCLPQDVRVASSQAYEVRMGFAPTKVQDNQSNQYLLNWTTAFFDYKDVEGKDILLSDKQVGEMPPIVNESDSDIEYFIADYSEGLEFLYIGKSEL